MLLKIRRFAWGVLIALLPMFGVDAAILITFHYFGITASDVEAALDRSREHIVALQEEIFIRGTRSFMQMGMSQVTSKLLATLIAFVVMVLALGQAMQLIWWYQRLKFKVFKWLFGHLPEFRWLKKKAVPP